MPDEIVWEVFCRCGYYAMGIRSAGWRRPVPSPPRLCPVCDGRLQVDRPDDHGAKRQRLRHPSKRRKLARNRRGRGAA